MPAASKAPAKRKLANPPRVTTPALAPEFPWERQPQEPDHAWEAFVAYRDLGPGERSQVKTGEKLGVSRTIVGEWGVRWDWVARCRAFDAWVDKQRVAAHVAEVVDMRRRHTQVGMTLQGVAAMALNKIAAAEREGKEVSLKPSEVRDFLELGTKIERTARGEPETIGHVSVTPDAPSPAAAVAANAVLWDYSKLSIEELRTLRALHDKARFQESK